MHIFNYCIMLFQIQTIRVLGLLGALDPYKRKLNKSKGSTSSSQGLPVSEAIHKNANAQDGNRQGNYLNTVMKLLEYTIL